MKTMSTQISRKSDQFLRTLAGATVAFSSACFLLITAPAMADDMADVTKFLRAGQTSEALSKIDAVLDRNPRDMQMLFVKGVVLTEQGKTPEAINIFTKLTEDHPDLPEPYNNLAVLFASTGQYDKARAALDMAIRTNPSYATAYENLGDVHAKLASQAYDKALQLDSGNASTKSKLTLLRTLTINLASKDAGSKTTVTAAVPVTPAKKPVAPVTPAPLVVAAADTTKDNSVNPRAESKAKAESKQVVKAEVKPEVKSDPKSAARPVASSAENEEVSTVVQDWAQAWSAQDVKRYLNHYGPDFETGKGESRKAWADERTARIVGKSRITVTVESPQITVNGNTATVKFRQLYVSDRLKADSRKTLVLSKQSGKWQIKQERTGG
jgi:tetratricopeptide (TPR) repeat protein